MGLPRKRPRGRVDEVAPHDDAAEQALLATALLSPSAALELFERFDVDDFFSLTNQAVFRGICRLIAADKAVEPITLHSECKEALNSETGPILRALFELMPNVASFESYASIVKETADKRRQWIIFQDFQAQVDAGTPLSEAFIHATERIQKDVQPVIKTPPIVYPTWTMTQLQETTDQIEDLIQDVLVAGQPCVVAGPKKAMKTSILTELAVSLATKSAFANRFRVTRACRVLFMSGESGIPTLRETVARVCESKGIDVFDVENLIISNKTPVFDDPMHEDAMRSVIAATGAEVVIFDPAYMCIEGDGNEGNLFSMGRKLRRITELCEKAGAMMILVHHSRKNVLAPYQPPELEDIAWAGFQEFARQWILISRRQRYEPGTGQHKLHLCCGGSAGHGGQWGIDISEGIRKDGRLRHWEIQALDVSEIRQEEAARRREANAERDAEKADDRKRKLLEAIKGLYAGRGTASAIADAAAMGHKVAKFALEQMCADGLIYHDKIKVGTRKTLQDGYSVKPPEQMQILQFEEDGQADN